jgi:hypothetical protein
VIANYLQHELRHHETRLNRVTQLNRVLLDSYRTDVPAAEDLPTAWWQLPADEPYLWHHLALHLHAAGLLDELAGMLGDLRWTSTKMYRLGPASVQADAALLPHDTHAQALCRLVRGTSQLYAPGDPTPMNGVTLGAYASGDPVLSPAATLFLERLPRPYLRPTAPPLPDQPHPNISRILASNFDGTDALVVAPDGSWMASAGHSDAVKIWNPTEGTELCSLPGSQDGAWALAIAPDGSWLASGGTDGLVRIWNMPQGTERVTLTGHRRNQTSGCGTGRDMVGQRR